MYRTIQSFMLIISIHALREEGDLWDNFKYFMGEVISIHALREEGDLPSCP